MSIEQLQSGLEHGKRPGAARALCLRSSRVSPASLAAAVRTKHERIDSLSPRNQNLYYFGLLSAAPYLRAAMVGYEVAALNPALSGAERKTYATRGNAAEEKLVRVSDAMMFAVKDLDGSESRVKRAEIQKALATGDEDKAQGLAMEAVDLKLFYPKPFKQVLLQPDPKA